MAARYKMRIELKHGCPACFDPVPIRSCVGASCAALTMIAHVRRDKGAATRRARRLSRHSSTSCRGSIQAAGGGGIRRGRFVGAKWREPPGGRVSSVACPDPAHYLPSNGMQRMH